MIAEREATLVMVSHDQAMAERCDRILALDIGSLVSDVRTAA